MDQFPLISLEKDWLCEYFEREPDVYEFASSGLYVPTLPDWSCSGRYDSGWAAYLHHTFTLEPADVCVSYILEIESAPGNIMLYINGRRMGTFDGSRPFSFDVTDYVALEDNTIALRVDCAARGQFGAVYLKQVPCD